MFGSCSDQCNTQHDPCTTTATHMDRQYATYRRQKRRCHVVAGGRGAVTSLCVGRHERDVVAHVHVAQHEPQVPGHQSKPENWKQQR